MAVFQSIRNFFVPTTIFEPEIIVSAPLTRYEIRPLTDKHLKEVLKLNLRCFKAGENYTKYTFSYLLNEPATLSYRIVTPSEQIVAFVFVMTGADGTGHITTIGVAPEHRRRGLANKLLLHTEEALQKRSINTVMLEVRVSNLPAQNLYREFGYATVQRLVGYYNNGEDGFLMVKSLL
ncbi:MAG TPA: ribosomal protein S18-alanine N-acetyltransferase [Pyrinomonadaceae bacterium]|nr:ribosomal protein S18-alanine N-acetyltransferase [Pyrinomonadaceae bacterium]